MNWTAVISSQEDWKNIASVVSGLKIAADSCNEESFTELDFSRFGNVKNIEIGSNSLKSVNRMNLDGMNKLGEMDIAQTSLVNTRELTIGSNSLNCPELTSINLKAFNHLQKLAIGSNAMTKMKNITISHMDELKSLSIGSNAMNEVIKYVIERYNDISNTFND